MSNRFEVALRLTAERPPPLGPLAQALVQAADAARADKVQPSEDIPVRLLLHRMAVLCDVPAIGQEPRLYGRLFDECSAKAEGPGRNRFWDADNMQRGGPGNISGLARSLVTHPATVEAEGGDPRQDSAIRMMVHHISSVAHTWQYDEISALAVAQEACRLQADALEIAEEPASGPGMAG